jgi:small subunit ribosomal protein S1
MNDLNNNHQKPKDQKPSLYDYEVPQLSAGEIVKGKVVRTLANGVVVDIGLKSEAFLGWEEFRNPETLKEGDEILVYVETLENREGLPIISHRKAEIMHTFKIFEDKFQSQEPLEAKVVNKVKGGLTVEVLGFPAFLPGSQIDIKPVMNFDELVGKTLEVRIVALNSQKRNVVVSRRVILEEALARARERVFSYIKPGDVVLARVTGLQDFGAFVEIDGVPALLHISDISWEKIVHPKEVLKIGDEIKVKVLNVDYENYRITVGLKQLTKHPWEEIETRYPIGTKIKGKITAIVNYGAFVKIEENLEGLIHISEMSWDPTVTHPSQVVKVGDEVEAVVLNIDRDARKISLGLKQTLPDPWSVIDEKYQIGEKVDGRVIALRNYGALVELEPGIVGLIRNQDLSWTKKVRHPREILKRNQKVQTIVLDIDREARQLTLGLKQTEEDPFYTFSTNYKIGDLVKARISDIVAAGLVVSLPYGLEGFVPRTQLVNKLPEKEISLKEAEAQENIAYQIGREIELKITFVDYEQRKIRLSEKMVFSGKQLREQTRIPKEELTSEPPKPRFTLEDHLSNLEILEKKSEKKKKHKK